jgi:hypothetical protein
MSSSEMASAFTQKLRFILLEMINQKAALDEQETTRIKA